MSFHPFSDGSEFRFRMVTDRHTKSCLINLRDTFSRIRIFYSYHCQVLSLLICSMIQNVKIFPRILYHLYTIDNNKRNLITLVISLLKNSDQPYSCLRCKIKFSGNDRTYIKVVITLYDEYDF